MTTISPPENLPTGRRVYPALVIPFGQAVDASHEDAGRVYSWGDAPRLPRRDVPVDVDHDGRAIGIASGFALTGGGIWASLKVGVEGERLVGQGHRSLSVELDSTGTISAVSLVVRSRPAFRSAGLWPGGRPPARGGFGLMSAVTVGPGSQAPVPEFRRPSMVMRSVVFEDPEAEVVRFQEAWRDRVESLHEAETDWEAELAAYMRRNKQIREQQQAAKAVADVGARAAATFAERMEQLEAEAERERRPWWRRLVG